MKPGHRILVVNGAGQKGLWEDVAGRQGDIASVAKFRASIAIVSSNRGDARTDWINDKSLDAWLIWNIWQVSNPSLADIVSIDEAHQIYRDAELASQPKESLALKRAHSFGSFNLHKAQRYFKNGDGSYSDDSSCA
jgi:accessory colonization factor AcfC